MRPKLTERQRQILEFIAEQIAASGGPPSVREIGKRFSFRSTNAVCDHLRALERKGYIKRSRGHRNILLAPHLREKGKGIPLVGQVAAGTPALAIENIEGYVQLDNVFGTSEQLFMLKVQGDSMIDAGIHEGDYVVVTSQPDLENGEIGVVVIGEEATVKKVFKERTHIRLQPANARLKPIYIEKNTEDFRIAGKVIGTIRKR